MATAPASCMSTENGCVMFDCLVHLWEWIDPPIQQSQFQMDNKKNLPATQQPLNQHHIMAHHVHPDQIYTQQQMSNHLSNKPIQNQPNGVIHQPQLIQNQYHANMTARSPLLENRHEIYGTSHNHEYARHYGANDNYNYQHPKSPITERTEQIIHTDHNVNHDIIHNIPKGYNAEVYQDYLKRNPPKDNNQIYQNHQPPYRPNMNQYGSKPYLPYSNRIGPQSNTELLRRQYNEIQQLKMQQQLHYQNQAQMQQQQKFAERQLLLQQIHGVQPPPNLQNSIYSDSSYRDLDRYSSRNDFKDYTGDIHKDVDKYAKNNEYRETEKQNKQFQDGQWQHNQESAYRDTDRIERYRNHEEDKVKQRSPPTDFNNQLQRNNAGSISPMKSSESSTPSIKSPSSESRRSSSGQALRSPTAQRIPSAPVTMSGMLYKQGSDGLKVWRKRWFVLSEYCLFYYKSQDEEKLLGSVLLPSYKVSACTSEDKVMRKFAFKLEHANMRTYVLAAMDQESMMKWVKALTMAALMQNYSEHQQKQNERTTVKTELDDDIPGPTYANAPPKPRRSNDGYNSPSSDIYDPNYDLLIKPESQYNQGSNRNQYQDQNSYGNKRHPEPFLRSPLSPPVPRSHQRQNEAYNVATTQITDRNQDQANYKFPQSPSYDQRSTQQQLSENIYTQRSHNNPFLQNYPAQDTRKETQANPISPDQISNKNYGDTYETRANSNAYEAKSYSRDLYSEMNPGKPAHSGTAMNERITERRTPDAYSRSTTMSSYKNKIGDYEDVYSAYPNENPAKSPNLSMQRDNISLSSQKQGQKPNQSQEKVFSGPSVLRRKKMQASGVQPPMPRPHSADFLEYEAKNDLNKSLPSGNISNHPKHPQRPKSSLDINSYYDPSSDTYYSEESYAEKMRQSAQYLQQQAVGPRNMQIPLAKYASGLAEKQLHSPYAHSTNNNYETEFGMKHNRDNISYTSKYSDLEGLNSNWMLKEKDLEAQKNYLNRSGSVMSDGSNASYIKEASKLDPSSDGFIRSASARLPSTEREGEKKLQQREESMKRLLEWKQRMLQSPLTRKSTPATISLARSLNQSRQSLRSDQFKPKTYANNSYNSYSSDDEEKTPGTDLQNSSDMQAGRSYVEDLGSSSLLQPIPPYVPCSTNKTDTKDKNTNENKVMNDENAYENVMCEDIVEKCNNKDYDDNIYEDHTPGFIETPDKQNNPTFISDGYETHDSESESEVQIEYTDNDLDEVLQESEDERVKSEDNATNEVANNIDEESLNKMSETPPIQPLGEDHYLPMSPRKSLSNEPAHKMILENLSVFDESMPFPYEDNPYVEMNIGSEEDDMQTYEIVCVSNGKMNEPVYMELNNLTMEDNKEDISSKDCYSSDTASNFADTKDPTLKRISKTEKAKEKTESSEADDDCSKDVSLDAPFSRLSISDTFRPASYYLSGSRTLLDVDDNVNNEEFCSPQVSQSAASCDDLSDDALSKYILDKLDKSDISQDNSILKMLTNEKQNMNKMKKKATSLMIYGSRTSIHDTLTRGEKVRHNRASLNNDRNKMYEGQDTANLLNRSLYDLKQISSDCMDSDSYRSCNIERTSSRLSLDSDVSSKFEIAPSNISSEITSLIDTESMLDLHPSHFGVASQLDSHNLNVLDKLSNSEDIISSTNHPQINFNECVIHSNPTSSTNDHSEPQFSHSRSSSTPVNCNVGLISNERNKDLQPKRLAAQYNSIVDPASGYIGSQSSCSSVGVSNSPISFYTKNYKGETLLRKNLNKNNVTDKIKDFESEKINIKEKYATSPLATAFHSRESSTEQSAPYYYSDLSSQEHINILPSHYLKNTNMHRKLNNQRRRGLLQKKNEISHIHNPIHNNHSVFRRDNSFELAAARSVSVEFLSATEKDTEIDMKNIYESTGNKPSKIPESINLLPGLGCKKGAKSNKNDKQNTSADTMDIQQRNLLKARVSTGSMSSHCSENSSNTVYYDAETEANAYENVCIGENHWDEDNLWRDNLRRVSHRHARSMDDLDAMTDSFNFSTASNGLNSIKRVKKSPSKPSATYVNCDIQGQVLKNVAANDLPDENDVYVSLANDVDASNDEGVYEQLSIEPVENASALKDSISKNIPKNKKQFEIDRETLRQWDLMSSGLMKSGSGRVRGAVVSGDIKTACGLDKRLENTKSEASMTMSGTNTETNPNNNQVNQQSLSKKAFLGSNTSIGRNTRDGNIPVRAVSPRVRWVEDKNNEQYGTQQMSASQQNLNMLPGTEESWTTIRSPSRISQQPVSAVSPRIRRNTETEELQKVQKDLVDIPTAGELLGRSHEELVLLLIQLRRRHSATHRSIEQCCLQINSIEECLSSLKAIEREESLRRLEQLKLQLMELEQQYAKSKPLVQLVDNMVKLGSLYNKPGSTIERLERNQRLRHKVLAEHALEQQRWLESAAAGKPLETEAARARVAELWALEQELADEASILQGLKTDKDAIESMLSGVRSKLDSVNLDDPLPGGGLEAELARVHSLLAHNSKKLEQTVAENARLERELQQLRRALRARRSTPTQNTHPTALLEDEVTRVQQLVTALQRQRQELSRAVRHLTQQSHVLQTTHDSMPGNNRPSSYWQETNLDTGHTTDHGQDYYGRSGHYGQNVEPLYVDTRAPGDITSPMSEEQAFGNLSNIEKQEIKTVRIVKRESERRQRDRERSLQPMSDWSSNITANLDQFLEEELVQPINNYRASSVPRDYSKFEDYYSKQIKEAPYLRFEKNMELSPKYPSSPSLSNYDYSRDLSYKSYDRSGYDRLSLSNQYLNSPTDSARTLTNDPISKTSSVMSLTRSNMELSPIFKSEAAKQIITEMSDTNGSLHRRQVPKEKRRHYTAPHHLSAKTLNELPKESYKQDAMGRSVDDADMERALRGAAPDVVRSALPSTKIPDSIDQLLAAPQKIVIPERYIPEKPPELSPEEQQKRQEKVESIKKMLSSTSADPSKSPDGEQKKQREHLLQMNQILAKQVTEMSKIIAVKALEELPTVNNAEDSDRSPDVELPIYQQRENFFT